ncbi:Cysteine-rich repeat secretory protein 60 [Apostasia shenzhenica]|uniref:Cysteine-rich repeat secretory protein 60 n=1 Tax=Apostasia shenzhenica TaxID=1088818 RepID=A0A2I0B0W5_9ASPA|nr:Cysteine-rich repeat secretory protein 60 [Apostasia shenzhenica]
MGQLPFLLLLLSSATIAAIASADDDPTGFVYAGCSQPKYSPGSPFEYNVDSLLSSLANAAASSPYANFTSAAAVPSPPVSGLFQCRGDLAASDCSSCVRSALSRLSSFCPAAMGAALQLRACYLRYGNDSFLGRPDTSLLYKTCATGAAAAAAGGVSDFLEARDSALSSLSGSSYRVGAAGGVRADGQCVGDLSADQCSDCLAAAGSQVKASCGGAASGEAYLGKCYIRYYSNGAPAYAYGVGGVSSGGSGGKISYNHRRWPLRCHHLIPIYLLFINY